MVKGHEISLNPREEGDQCTCPRLWRLARSLIHKFGRQNLPGFFQTILAVAQQAGRVTLYNQPARPTLMEQQHINVLSANLWHDWPRFKDLTSRLESFARLAEDQKADLILVQEMVRTRTMQADSWLSERLGMAYVYTRANGAENIGFEEGLGVFSRYPLQRLHLRQLSRGCNPFVRRLVLGAVVDTPFGEILAFSVHLGLLRWHNSAQLLDLRHWIARLAQGRSVLIGGDFNSPDHSKHIRQLSHHWIDAYQMAHHSGPAETHALRLPWGNTFFHQRLDYIFVQPGAPAIGIDDVRHLDSPDGPHSDHRAVLARFLLSPNKVSEV